MNISIIYNLPSPDRYSAMGESKAELGVTEEVEAVGRALTELQYPFVCFPLSPPLKYVEANLQAIQKGVVFNLFEGFDGRPETESKVAAMLAKLKVPFTGCPPEALSLALDKARTKDRLAAAGIPTPKYQILGPENIMLFDLNLPCIVKPLADDASHGISENSVVFDFASLKKQVAAISHRFRGKVMVEEYVDGREFNTTVLGNDRLTVPAVSEIVYTLPPDKPHILTFEAKWEESSVYFKNTKVFCPARISTSEYRQISRIAKAAFKLTGCRGYARVDFRQDRSGRFKVLEVNPNPDISPGGGVSLQIAAAGLTYTRFIARIIDYALKTHGDRN